MNTEQRAARVIDWIHGARQMGKKNGLENMVVLLEKLGNPHAQFRSMHVAGTNGKGSTCAFIERALRESGRKTGLYTSPYLCRYHERIQLNGAPIDNASIARLGAKLRAAFDELCQENIFPTTFELGTALAFLFFAEQKVDIAVVEVGLGGRLDPTNVITPLACAIASISIDHTKALGDTIAEIAREKAGIIKLDIPVALYPQLKEADEVIAGVCEKQGAPLYRVADHPARIVREDAYGARFSVDEEEYEICLPGRHQIDNARLAIESLTLLNGAGLPINNEAVRRGLHLAEWPGRLEWLRPDLLIDGAHNLQGARALSEYLERYFGSVRKVLLTGMMQDKQVEKCAGALAGLFDEVIATTVDWPKALPAEELANVYRRLGTKARAVPDARAALREAQAAAGGDLLVVAGSLYLVGTVRGDFFTE